MGWLDTFGFTKKDDDPLLNDLDPELRKYLKSQAPSTYKTAQEKSDGSAAPPQTYREQLGLKHNDPEAQEKNKLALASAAATAGNAQDSTTPQPLPREALYQDGRYAHLWATYRPQNEIEEAGKSDQEKLLDIVHGYRERQAEVGRAALENCSNEQWAVHECFRHGTWSALATMCKKENRELGRCITMQSKFLRALGYLTMYERPAAESERIQMHADRLYQQMLEQERRAEEAKKTGQNPAAIAAAGAAADMARDAALSATSPQSSEKPHISLDLPPPPSHNRMTWETLPSNIQQKILNGRFKGLEGSELELAKLELSNNLSFHQDFVQRMDKYAITEREKTLERIKVGEPTVGDRVRSMFDFRKYPEMEGGEQATEGEKQ